jgi:hypothetical protein
VPPKADVVDTLRAGLVGLVLGFLGGLIVFFVGSSRGLNVPGLETVVIVVAGISLLVAVVVAIGRAAFGSAEAVVAVGLFFFGAIAGYGNGLRIVPGSTTDGTAEVVAPSDLPTHGVSGKVTCRWADGTVAAVASRGALTWSLTEQATLSADVTAGTATASVTSRVDDSVRTLDGSIGGLEAAGARGAAMFPRGAVVRWSCPPLP